MRERERFLSGFTPLPEGSALPRRLTADYEAESCLSGPEDGRLVLRLRRKADGASVVLKAAPVDRVRLEMTSGVAPCVIVPAEGEHNFIYMVLPVRLKAN